MSNLSVSFKQFSSQLSTSPSIQKFALLLLSLVSIIYFSKVTMENAMSFFKLFLNVFLLWKIWCQNAFPVARQYNTMEYFTGREDTKNRIPNRLYGDEQGESILNHCNASTQDTSVSSTTTVEYVLFWDCKSL